MSGRRCPHCGGLVGADAEWCGQCFQRLDAAPPAPAQPAEPTPAPPVERPSPVAPAEAAPQAEPAPRSRRLIKAQGDALAWTCPTCGNENAIEAQACAACGTPFATLFAESEARPATEPGRAQALSLLFPGLGHAGAGRGAEGLARAVAFLWLAGSAVAILVIRRGLGLGPFLPLVLLLLSAAVVLYAFTAVDARRAAEGRPPMLTTRMLMYGVTGMILLTVLVLVVTGIRASRG